MQSPALILKRHPHLEQELPLLGLFQGYTAAPILGQLCARPQMPSPWRQLQAGHWIETLDLLKTNHLAQSPEELAAFLDPACSNWLRQLLQELPESSQATLERAFVETYADFATRLTSGLADPQAALARLRPEEQNLLQALALAQRHHLWRPAHSLTTGLETLFLPAGHWKEWLWVLATFDSLVHPDDAETTRLWVYVTTQKAGAARHQQDYQMELGLLLELHDHFERHDQRQELAQTLHQMGQNALAQLDHEAASLRFRECLAFLGPHEEGRPEALHDLGLAASRSRDFDLAESSFSEALDLAISRQDLRQQARLLTLLGKVARARPDPGQAQNWFLRLLALEEKCESPAGQAEALEYLGHLSLSGGDACQAEHFFRRGACLWKDARNEEREARMFSALAQALVAQGKIEPADALYRRSLQLLVRLGNRTGQAETLSRMGQLALDRKKLDQARHCLAQANTLLHGVHEPGLLARILETLGAVAYQQNDLRAAESAFEEAIKLRRELNEPHAEAAALCNLALVAERREQFKPARHYLQASLEIGRRTQHLPTQLDTLLQLAGVAFQEQDFPRARALCQETLKLAQESDSPNQLAQVHYRLGRIHARLGRFEEARNDYESSLRLMSDIPDLPGQIRVLSHLADLPNVSATDTRALHHRSLALSEKAQDQASQVQLLYQLATLAETRGQWVEAEHYYRRCLTIDQAIGARSHQALILQRIGLVLEHLGRRPEAARLYQRSLRLAGWPSGDHPFHAAITLSMGESALVEGDHEDAFVYYQHAIKLAEYLKDPVALASAALGLGRVARHQNSPEQARAWFDRAKEAAPRDQSALLAAAFCRLAELDGVQGRFQEAEDHYMAALKLQESLADAPAQAATRFHLGVLAESAANPSEAAAHFRKSLALYEELRDLNQIYRVRTALSSVAHWRWGSAPRLERSSR